jgi:hypothetical protein
MTEAEIFAVPETAVCVVAFDRKGKAVRNTHSAGRFARRSTKHLDGAANTTVGDARPNFFQRV